MPCIPRMYSFEASDPAASSMAPLPASHPAHWPFLKGDILSTSFRATRLPAWPDCNLRGTLSAGAASRLPAFIAFVNGKCDETGIDLSAKPGRSAERVENNDNEWIDDFVARPDWRLEQPCSKSETTAIKRLLPIAPHDLMYPEKNRPMLLFTRTVCLPFPHPQISLRPLCGGKWTNSPRHHHTPNVVKMCC